MKYRAIRPHPISVSAEEEPLRRFLKVQIDKAIACVGLAVQFNRQSVEPCRSVAREKRAEIDVPDIGMIHLVA